MTAMIDNRTARIDLIEHVRHTMMWDKAIDPYGSVRLALTDVLAALYVTGNGNLIPSDWKYRPGLSVQWGEVEEDAHYIVSLINDEGLEPEYVAQVARALYRYESLCVAAGRDY